ncbi:hypothetical protein Tsubulata_028545 [Turnera subulata]|uniref:Cytochrome P450 82G1-like n=1 Tax=Turnera subulata TaxID=218843 RepID=A0A9Q0FKH3_9ROSI|nr:hypothetical protein Tsubulata_028545 [Turnera subulata]
MLLAVEGTIYIYKRYCRLMKRAQHLLLQFSLYFIRMDSSIFLEACLLLVLLCILWHSISKSNRTNKKTRVPQPSGAFPLIGHLRLLGNQAPACKTLAAIADQYGPIYMLKLGIHPLLVVSGWEIVKDCLTTNDRTLATRASIAAGKHLGYNNAIIALAPYGKYWRDLRKLATLQLFSNLRLDLLKHVRAQEVQNFIKELFTLCSKNGNHSTRVSMNKFFEGLTFNISLRMIVGKRYSSSTYSAENSEAWRYKKAIEKALYLSGIFVMSDAIPWLEWMDIDGHVSAMKETSKELDSVIRTWVEEHLRKRSEDQQGKINDGECDFLDVMIANLQPEAEISGHSRDVILKATVMILTLTGSGSTATTLTWALSLLLNHPTALKLAQAELDTHVGKGRWVEETDIENLKYLQAVVKETLRLYPPGPLTGIREAMEDCTIGGYYVPKGTRLVVNIWKLHRDPRIWENPCEFQPERFLTTHADIDFRGQNFEYLPFSSGRRSCPAINLGVAVVHLGLARVLQGFDITTIGGLPVDMTESPGIALPKNGRGRFLGRRACMCVVTMDEEERWRRIATGTAWQGLRLAGVVY